MNDENRFFGDLMTSRLPNMLIIGAAKAGTTALYRYLNEHPDIYMSAVKETNYFACDGDDTKAWTERSVNNKFKFRTLDEYRQLFSEAGEASVVGEASPLYLESPTAASRIHALLPEVRLIASLRDPADRAFSAYMMKVRHARETWRVDKAFDPESHYVRVGFYYEKVKRYYDLFPSRQIKVVLFNDLRRAPLDVCKDLFGFLGVDEKFSPDMGQIHNVGAFPKNKLLNVVFAKAKNNEILMRIMPDWLVSAGGRLRRKNLGAKLVMEPELRARLVDLYRDDVARLQDLIDRDLSSWLRV